MKTVETKLYSFAELSESAQNRVIERIAQGIHSDPDNFTLDDCMDSLKAIVSSMGCKLSNWSIGPYNRGNFAKVSIPWHQEDDLEGGNKTLALFLRALIAEGYDRPKTFKEMAFPGVCGFTGVCYDDDIAESIWTQLMCGESFAYAVSYAADEIGRICESELEYQTSREAILETLDQDSEIYTEEGEEF